MGWFVFIAVVMYFGIGIAVTKRYFLKRHGLGIAKGSQGGGTANFVGMFWPVSLCLASVRAPQRCNHPRHVQAVAEYLRDHEFLKSRSQ